MLGVVKNIKFGPFPVRKFASSASSFRLDQDSVVTKVKDQLFRGNITDRWSIGNAPNGGYLMLMAINAAKQCVPHPDPLTVTAFYFNKGIEGAPVDIDVKILSKSRSSSTAYISMAQEGDVKCEYTAVFGSLDHAKGFSFSHKSAVQLPPREECFNASTALRKKFGKALQIANETEIRVPQNDPFVTGWLKGKQGDRAALNCWIGLADKRKPCLPSMAFYSDAMPPPILNLKPTNWVPTIELSVHFWNKPPVLEGEDAQWIRGKFETLYSNNGFLYTDGELWSADGKILLATNRQFARVLEPRQ
jgi:acyl-CoA thioesterase